MRARPGLTALVLAACLGLALTGTTQPAPGRGGSDGLRAVAATTRAAHVGMSAPRTAWRGDTIVVKSSVRRGGTSVKGRTVWLQVRTSSTKWKSRRHARTGPSGTARFTLVAKHSLR